MTDRETADAAAQPEPEPGLPPEGQAEEAQRRRPKKRTKPRGADAASKAAGGAPDQQPDPELARLEQAFERGDYALVREGAARLAKEAERDDVRRAARQLLRRIDPDPLAVTLLLAAVALLAFLALWYWSHAHGA